MGDKRIPSAVVAISAVLLFVEDLDRIAEGLLPLSNIDQECMYLVVKLLD